MFIYSGSNIQGKEMFFKAFGSLSIFFFTSLLFVSTGSLSLFGQLISISAKFDTTTIWIGEQTNFIITIEQLEEMYVGHPLISDTLSSVIEILKSSPPDTIITDDNKLRIINTYRVTSFEPGEHYVQPLGFLFFVEGDEKVIYTPPVLLQVLSPEIDESKGVYDIKSPFGIPLGVFEILRWTFPVILLLLLIWYIIRFLKRNKEGKPLFKPDKPEEPAHTIALRKLKQLKEESLWQQGRVKEYYTRLTEIVRIYIEKHFVIMAMEQTSDEIIEELKHKLTSEIVGLLQSCFSTADLVKFAKAIPGEDEHEKCINIAFRFVKETCEAHLDK